MNNIKKHMDIMGRKVVDKVTGLEGVIESVSFDLYGCIQALIRPLSSKKGELKEGYWMDISRFKILKGKPVMNRPNFSYGDVAEAKHGPASKPRAI